MTTAAAPRPMTFSPPAATGASQATSPPPRLPGEHFAAALIFFVCGTLGLAFVAPDLAAGAFYLPRVVAIVHLFTLGWIILSIFGALCQFLPVAVGQPIRWEKLAHVSFFLQTAGAVLFVAALLTNDKHLLHAGAAVVSSAFLLFALNLGATLAQVTERPLTWWALAGATVFLVVTPIYGMLLAINLHDGMLGAERFVIVARHSHVAIVGVVMLVVVGVAHRLLPMFLLSHGAGERAGQLAVGLLFAGALLLSIPVGGDVTALIAGVLVAAGMIAFLVQARSFFKHTKRSRIDPGMKLAASGLVGLAAALLMAPFALSKGLADPRLLATYHVVLIGALSLFVAGHYYKIVPFLVWYHRFGPLVGLRKVPKVTDLYSERVAKVNAVLLVGGWLGLVSGTWFSLPLLTRGAALVFLAGALLETVVVARVAQRKPA